MENTGSSVNRARRQRLIVAGIGFCTLILLAIATAGFFYYQQPARLRIAVGPPGSNDEQLVTGIAHRLNANGASVRLAVVTVETPAEVAKAFERGDADAAVLRSDFPAPQTARSVALFHRNVVLLATPSGSKIKSIPDLAGKTIGVVGRPGINDGILEAILRQYAIPANTVRTLTLRSTEIGQAVQAKRVDIVLAVGPLNGRAVTESVTALTGNRRRPTFLEIPDATAIAARLPGFETSEIIAGMFGGNPPQPAATITTLGFRHHLVVRQDLRDGLVGEFVRLIFDMRPSLMLDFPAADRIEALDTEKGGKIPGHPGAIAYYDGSERTFFDIYGDQIYFAIIALSIVGSIIGWVIRLALPAKRKSSLRQFELLMALSRMAPHATTIENLNDLDLQAETIYVNALQQTESGLVDEAQLMVFSLAVENLRQATALRRTNLSALAGVPR